MEEARPEGVNPEPRQREDYSDRQVAAARRVLVDVGQVLADFLVMKAHAIGGRDKPKDTYDLCYCLDQFPGGMNKLAAGWKQRVKEKDVARAIEILREKFASVEAFGPQQLVEFHSVPDGEMQAMHARRAYELVQKLLSLL